VSQVKAVNVEISVVLGRSQLPMQQLLRMGRGAVIPLDASATDEVWILANNHPVARGQIQISDDRIAIAVTGPANVYDFMAGGGAV
jgi:flagellar motor switch protein FliN